MYYFTHFLRDPEEDLFKAGRLFSFLANLIKESSPLISNIFKFFSFLIKFFLGKSFYFIFIFIFFIFLIFLILYFQRKKKTKK
jgi:hypothetical protein